MRSPLSLVPFALVLCCALSVRPAHAQVVTGSGIASLTLGDNAQIFDTVGNPNPPGLTADPGTFSSQLPTGWYFVESGAGENGTYAVDTGNNASPNVYSYGSGGGNTERAFGTFRDAGFAPMIGAVYRNDTGVTVTGLFIRFRGEQWRVGTAADRLDFQFNPAATSITDPGFVDVNQLDVMAFDIGAPTGQIGNDNSVALNFTLPTNIAPGGVFAIRWVDPLSAGSDAGLAIDEFRINAVPEPSVMALTAVGLAAALGGTWWKRRRPAGLSQDAPDTITGSSHSSGMSHVP